MERVKPRYVWYPHCERIAGCLQRVADGEISRLMIFLPPRLGKTELASRLFPAYYLHRYPERFVGINSYGQDLANTLSRAARENYLDAGGALKPDAALIKHWETAQGGGLWCAGVGGPITGKGFELGIIDDPLKNEVEAASELIRRRHKEWFSATFATREHPGGAIVLIMTRWNADDLAGWLLSEERTADLPERWHILSLPAIYEEPEPDAFPASCTVEEDTREIGEILCPERLPAERLKKQEQRGSYVFGALYQQRPRAREGNLFKLPWFRYVDAIQPGQRVRAWDLAATEGGGDFTSGPLMAKTAERLFQVQDLVRGQWSPGNRDAVICATAAKDGPEVAIWIEQEPGSGGKAQVHDLVRKLAGYSVRGHASTGDKLTRATPFAAQMEVGNVTFLKAPWNKALEEEMLAFPTGKHDDSVDGLSLAFAKLAGSVEICSL